MAKTNENATANQNNDGETASGNANVPTTSDKELELKAIENNLHAKEADLTHLQKTLDEKEQQLNNLSVSLTDKESELAEREKALDEKELQLKELESNLANPANAVKRPAEPSLEETGVFAVKDGEEMWFPKPAWENLGKNKNGWVRKVETPKEAQEG